MSIHDPLSNPLGHFHRSRRPGWGIARIVGLTLGGVLLAALFALAFGWLVMLLWNWLMPDIFSLKTISYWEAFGVVILAKLIFGGPGGFHGNHHGRFPHHRFAGSENYADDFAAPGGNHHNWVYYRKYWKERGKADFEAYLKEKGKTAENQNDMERTEKE